MKENQKQGKQNIKVKRKGGNWQKEKLKEKASKEKKRKIQNEGQTEKLYNG